TIRRCDHAISLGRRFGQEKITGRSRLAASED
ncbi:MAG: hypothetical protein ACJA0X_003298, partial [Cyclobacteriaceae bacterium]